MVRAQLLNVIRTIDEQTHFVNVYWLIRSLLSFVLFCPVSNFLLTFYKSSFFPFTYTTPAFSVLVLYMYLCQSLLNAHIALKGRWGCIGFAIELIYIVDKRLECCALLWSRYSFVFSMSGLQDIHQATAKTTAGSPNEFIGPQFSLPCFNFNISTFWPSLWNIKSLDIYQRNIYVIQSINHHFFYFRRSESVVVI